MRVEAQAGAEIRCSQSAVAVRPRAGTPELGRGDSDSHGASGPFGLGRIGRRYTALSY